MHHGPEHSEAHMIRQDSWALSLQRSQRSKYEFSRPHTQHSSSSFSSSSSDFLELSLLLRSILGWPTFIFILPEERFAVRLYAICPDPALFLLSPVNSRIKSKKNQTLLNLTLFIYKMQAYCPELRALIQCSPLSLLASCRSLGMIVTLLA